MKIYEIIHEHQLYHHDLARIYNIIGKAYERNGDHQADLKYSLKSLDIHEKIYEHYSLNLAIIYNNVSIAYENNGNHRKQFEFSSKSLKINEILNQYFPNNHYLA